MSVCAYMCYVLEPEVYSIKQITCIATFLPSSWSQFDLSFLGQLLPRFAFWEGIVLDAWNLQLRGIARYLPHTNLQKKIFS